MRTNNQNSKGGGCLGVVVLIVIFAFIIKSCGGNSNNDDKKDVTENTTTEKSIVFQRDNSATNQKKFIKAGKKFYDMYLGYFGEDFSIEDEPFKGGKYKGKNREKYKDLASVLDEMCMYYNGIEKRSDRYDALGELDFSTYDYIYNVRQMTLLIEDNNKYENEKLTVEYSDYIIG